MERCDADASGAEVAQYEVFLPSGKQLMLCSHHVRKVWPVIPDATIGLWIAGIDSTIRRMDVQLGFMKSLPAIEH